MAISSTFNALSDNWSLISSTAPTGGATSVSFTSIPSHRKLMIVDQSVLTTASAQRALRINNDSGGNNYIYSRFNGATPALDQGSGGSFTFSNATTAHNGFIIVDSCETSNPKTALSSGFNSIMIDGLYLSSAPVTRLDWILLSSSVSASNTASIYLYGVK